MNYASLAVLASDKIREYGKVAYIRRPGATTGWTKSWDVAQGRTKWTLIASPFTVVYADPAGIPVDIAGHVIEKAYQQKEIDGTTVMANDRRFLSSDLPLPTTADKLVVGGVILTIVSVSAIQPGDTTIVRTLQCRGV
jgi:hypothetical protein